MIATRCDELGIRPEFRPSLHTSWYGRGENAIKERRVELRRTAQARITAAGRRARLAIDTQTTETLTRLIAGVLETSDAREFLATIPTAEALMPAISIAELEEGR